MKLAQLSKASSFTRLQRKWQLGFEKDTLSVCTLPGSLFDAGFHAGKFAQFGWKKYGSSIGKPLNFYYRRKVVNLKMSIKLYSECSYYRMESFLEPQEISQITDPVKDERLIHIRFRYCIKELLKTPACSSESKQRSLRLNHEQVSSECQEYLSKVRGGHSIAPKTTSANAASASP